MSISRALGTKIYKFSRISSSKMDRFTSSQDQNDRRPILHISISSNTFRRRKCFFLRYLSVVYFTYVSFTWCWNDVDRSCCLLLTLVNGEVILRSKRQRSKSLGMRIKKLLRHIKRIPKWSSVHSTHIVVEYISQAKTHNFPIFVWFLKMFVCF